MDQLVQELGYVGFEVSNLGAWEQFAQDVLGAEVLPGALAGTARVRVDQQAYRFLLTTGEADDVGFVGWKLADAAALDAFARHLDAAGLPHSPATPADLELREVERMLWFRDPNGVRHEAYVGGRLAATPFHSPKVASGYVTAEGGLGHVVFGTGAYAESIAFARDILGAAVSDTIRQEIMPGRMIDVTFLHLNQRHHSIAFADLKGPKTLHHFMLEVGHVSDVGRARDRHIAACLPIVQDIGQHPNDQVISYYGAVPSGFLMEFGWGGVKVDAGNWQEGHYDQLSEWGHRPLVA